MCIDVIFLQDKRYAILYLIIGELWLYVGGGMCVSFYKVRSANGLNALIVCLSECLLPVLFLVSVMFAGI